MERIVEKNSFFLCHDLRIRLVHFSVSAMNSLLDTWR